MEETDKGWMTIRMVGGSVFLLVPAHPGSPGQRAVKRSLLLLFYVSLCTKQVISKMFPKPIYWLGMEKQNLTQEKHAFTDQNKCTTTQNKYKLMPG